MTQYKVAKGKRLGSVLVKQLDPAEVGFGEGPPQNIINAVASRLTAGRLVRGLSDQLWVC